MISTTKIKKAIIACLSAILVFATCAAIFSLKTTYATDESTTSVTYDFTMINGAETRTDSQKILRFTSQIKVSELDSLMANSENTVKVFTLITPTRYLTANEIADSDFTEAKLIEKGIKYHKVEFSAEKENLTVNKVEEYYKFQACEYNILEQNISRAFSARSFLDVNGEVIQYTDYSETNNSRAIYDVAKTAVDGGETDENVKALCKNYTVTFDSDYVNYTLTVKRGERLSYYSEELQENLTIENFAYATAYKVGENDYDTNEVISEDKTVKVEYDAVQAELSGETYTIKGFDENYTNHSTVINVPSTIKEKSVTAVDNDAFLKKKNNDKITKVILPTNVTFIGDEAFSGCSSLNTLIMPGVVKINENNSAYNMTNGCNALTTLVINGNLDMGRKVFYSDNASGITTVYLTSANNLKYRNSSGSEVSSYNTGDTNNTLFNGTFYVYDENKACGTWSYDENGDVVRSEHAFANGVCSKCGKALTEGLAYTYNANLGGYVVSKGTCSATEIYVRATYNDDTNGEKSVVAVASSTFQNNTKITKVVLPTSVTHIGQEAFFGCTKLETVIMPGVTSFYKVGEEGSIVVSDPTKAAGSNGDLGLNVFYKCNALKTVVVSKSVQLDRKTFFTEGDGSDAVKSKLDLYVYGANADSIKVRSDSSNSNNLLSGNYIFYSETKSVGCWHYDESGEPVLWSE